MGMDPLDCSPPGSSVHGDSPGKNNGVGCRALLQGIFPSLGLNPGLLHRRWILYHPSHQGSPRMLDWIAYPFSRESSQPRNGTGVSCIASGFFTSWGTRKALKQPSLGYFIIILLCHAKLTNGLPRWLSGKIKNLPAMRETWVQSLGWEDPLKEGMEICIKHIW